MGLMINPKDSARISFVSSSIGSIPLLWSFFLHGLTLPEPPVTFIEPPTQPVMSADKNGQLSNFINMRTFITPRHMICPKEYALANAQTGMIFLRCPIYLAIQRDHRAL
jgi:hypothetical protein